MMSDDTDNDNDYFNRPEIKEREKELIAIEEAKETVDAIHRLKELEEEADKERIKNGGH